jgi:hypothetical protein
MERHIIALADAYGKHWTHHLGPDGYTTGHDSEFVFVESEADPEDLTCDWAVGFEAMLSLGWNDETDPDHGPYDPVHHSGFTASVWEVDGFGDEQGCGQAIWTRAYPMHVAPTSTFSRSRI